VNGLIRSILPLTTSTGEGYGSVPDAAAIHLREPLAALFRHVGAGGDFDCGCDS